MFFKYQQDSEAVRAGQPAHEHNADDRSAEGGVHTQPEHKQQEGRVDRARRLHHRPRKRGLNDTYIQSLGC